MPGPTRWMLRLSLVYLVLGFSLGAILLTHKAVDLHPGLWALLPLHVELLFWGFVIQFTLGTAYWILPRYLEGPRRGNPKLAWLIVALINAGLWLHGAGLLLPERSGDIPRITGRAMELATVGLFIYLHWNRITSYRNR